MFRTTCRLLMTLLLLAATDRVWSQSYPSASVSITGSQNGGTTTGTMTLSFNGFSETVHYGQFSTPSSIASAFGAVFSSDPISARPRLCTVGVCAKANGAVITFQLSNTSASFGPFTLSTTDSSGTSPFNGILPNAGSGGPGSGSTTPVIYSIRPASGQPGDTGIRIEGTNFSTPGSVLFNGSPISSAYITTWTPPNLIIFTVPPGATTGPIQIITSNGDSNGVLFVVGPILGCPVKQ